VTDSIRLISDKDLIESLRGNGSTRKKVIAANRLEELIEQAGKDRQTIKRLKEELSIERFR
jgi:ABC-type oligopeptide transport system ATPase subunit